jgi:hypothetical protein
MRTRRHFQPMLDSMPARIAPSAVAGLTEVVAPPPIVIPSHPIIMHTDDTDMPQTGSSTPTPVPKPGA